jgi:acetyl-CoA carboxylase biotin carboxyl carrier protein
MLLTPSHAELVERPQVDADGAQLGQLDAPSSLDCPHRVDGLVGDRLERRALTGQRLARNRVGQLPDLGRILANAQVSISCADQQRRRSQEGGHLPEVAAHITGTVWKIEVEVGDPVEQGDTVVILESMKMEMPVEAEDTGVVKEITVEEGQSVSEGETLVVLE